MNSFRLAALALLAALPASAQTSISAEASEAFEKAAVTPFSKVAAQAGVAPKPKSCEEPGKELERAFTVYIPGVGAMNMEYAGCSEEDRNDLISGYTERSYKGRDGYALTIVTNHGDGAYVGYSETQYSDVLVSKGKDWVARFGTIPNAKIVSGGSVQQDGYALSTRNDALAACERAIEPTIYRDPVLWLITTKKAYFYREDCDICAELESCDLATGKVKSEVRAHSVSCSDADAASKGETVVFKDCR